MVIMLRLSTQIHKWLGLIVGLQVLGWVLGGVVMSAIPIERVRSEHHIAKFQPDPLPASGGVDWRAAAAALGIRPTEATLKSTLRGPLWLLKDAQGAAHYVDAITGRHVDPLPMAEARLLAGTQYQGRGRPVAVRWYAAPPQEAGKPGPLWAVDFDDAERTRFYVSPDTGEVVSRRSNVWRFYDVFWRIHILDFGAGDNYNTPWLVAAAVLSLIMTVTGLILLAFRLSRDWVVMRRQRQ
jgi:uncharacterized iron-regulated membrane protein